MATPLTLWIFLRYLFMLSLYPPIHINIGLKPTPHFALSPTPVVKTSQSVLTRFQVSSLLRFYDNPHPFQPKRVLRGYDKAHAHRTARMCVHVAKELGHDLPRLQQFEAACLLHDMGRAGLEPGLFGKIWSWAKQQGIPTRPREWRAAHPETPYGKESHAFIAQYKAHLKAQGLNLTPAVKDHIDM